MTSKKGDSAASRPSRNGFRRAEGSRKKLAEEFFSDLTRAWQEQGREILCRLAAEQPLAYVRGEGPCASRSWVCHPPGYPAPMAGWSNAPIAAGTGIPRSAVHRAVRAIAKAQAKREIAVVRIAEGLLAKGLRERR